MQCLSASSINVIRECRFFWHDAHRIFQTEEVSTILFDNYNLITFLKNMYIPLSKLFVCCYIIVPLFPSEFSHKFYLCEAADVHTILILEAIKQSPLTFSIYKFE